MEIGIFAKTFAGSSPMEVFAAARDAGYASVQYNMACSGIGSLPLEISDAVADEVAAASQETGITIAAISATYNMIHPDRSVREAGRHGFAAIASKAKRMGSQLLTVCSGSCDAEDQWRYHPDNDTGASWSEMIKEFRIIDEIAHEFDVRVGVEPELANIVNSAHKARALIDTLASDRTRIVFDPANLFERADRDARKRIIEDAIHLLEDRIAIAHAKDRDEDGGFTAAGLGVIDYDHYIKVLRSSGFNGVLVTHGLDQKQAKGVSRFLRHLVQTQ